MKNLKAVKIALTQKEILEDLDKMTASFFIFISEIGQLYPFVGLIFFFPKWGMLGRVSEEQALSTPVVGEQLKA